MNNNSKKVHEDETNNDMDDIGSGPVGRSLPSDNGRLSVDRERSYDPDTMYIRKTLDPELDAVRIENKAPWVSWRYKDTRGLADFIQRGVGDSESGRGGAAFSRKT